MLPDGRILDIGTIEIRTKSRKEDDQGRHCRYTEHRQGIVDRKSPLPEQKVGPGPHQQDIDQGHCKIKADIRHPLRIPEVHQGFPDPVFLRSLSPQGGKLLQPGAAQKGLEQGVRIADLLRAELPDVAEIIGRDPQDPVSHGQGRQDRQVIRLQDLGPLRGVDPAYGKLDHGSVRSLRAVLESHVHLSCLRKSDLHLRQIFLQGAQWVQAVSRSHQQGASVPDPFADDPCRLFRELPHAVVADQQDIQLRQSLLRLRKVRRIQEYGPGPEGRIGDADPTEIGELLGAVAEDPDEELVLTALDTDGGLLFR